jgi:hypothetical protein
VEGGGFMATMYAAEGSEQRARVRAYAFPPPLDGAGPAVLALFVVDET